MEKKEAYMTPIIDFEQAVTVLGDTQSGPPGQVYLERKGVDWNIVTPGEQFLITQATFTKLAEAQCIQALEDSTNRFVPNKYCVDLAHNIHA